MAFEDKQIICRDCGEPFVFTAGEQQFYQEKGLEHEPQRCRACRTTRRSRDPEGGRGMRTTNRVMTPVICASCGQQTTVPFEPKLDRPVYCSACFEQQRASFRR